MNQNLIFVFILFATLSVANSLPHQLVQKIKWQTCLNDKDPYPSLDIKTSVNDIAQGQNETFTVSASLPEVITETDMFELSFFDFNGGESYNFSTPVCGKNNLPQCPIKANTKFSVKQTIKVPRFPPINTFELSVKIGKLSDNIIKG
ncbi:14048_t:CDS:1, partial [Racocetra persica]